MQDLLYQSLYLHIITQAHKSYKCCWQQPPVTFHQISSTFHFDLQLQRLKPRYMLGRSCLQENKLFVGLFQNWFWNWFPFHAPRFPVAVLRFVAHFLTSLCDSRQPSFRMSALQHQWKGIGGRLILPPYEVRSGLYIGELDLRLTLRKRARRASSYHEDEFGSSWANWRPCPQYFWNGSSCYWARRTFKTAWMMSRLVSFFFAGLNPDHAVS